MAKSLMLAKLDIADTNVGASRLIIWFTLVIVFCLTVGVGEYRYKKPS